ncbi:hypothetical protein E2320_022195 [Naja naja]|nr:hypothetical protein E2320_022195 [Naja naja]
MTGLPLLLLLLLFWLLPPMAAEKTQTICVSQKGLTSQNRWEYYRPGDLVIGGNLPLAALMCSTLLDFQNHPLWLIYSPSGTELADGSQNDDGERFISSLVPMLKEKEICLAFTEMMKSDFSAVPYTKLNQMFNTWSKGEVIILYGDSSTITNEEKMVFAYKTRGNTSFLKVWIFTSNWKLR